MIDVSHRGTAELSEHFAHARLTQTSRQPKTEREEQAEEEEAAWLSEVQSMNPDNVAAISELQSGALVLDMASLREAPNATSPAARRNVKGKMPA